MKKKNWIAPKRNYENIQFGKLRKKVDPAFNECHDVLSKAYYGKIEFVWKGKNWGVLSKELFDKLHGLIFHLRTLEFHKRNLLQAAKDRIPATEYNDTYDLKGKLMDRETDRATIFIKKLKDEEIELEI